MKNSRPFYTDLAWAYDLIIAGPVSRRCDFVENALRQRQVAPGSRILDAGCGTGNYSIELARRQYVVAGLDASAELIAEAEKKRMHLVRGGESIPRCGSSNDEPASFGRAHVEAEDACSSHLKRVQKKSKEAYLPLTFQVGDILALPSTPRFDGILCRGVLNDLTDAASRQQVFVSFAQALRQGGVLLLDVREWYTTSLRKLRTPVFARSIETDRGKLTFCSDTRLDYKRKQLVVQERHSIKKDGVETVSEYDFTMRCWTKEELRQNLLDAGFGSIAYFGDYDQGAPVYTTDRIVAVATMEHK